MKEKLIWVTTRTWCFRASLIGGFCLDSNHQECVVVSILDFSGHVIHEIKYWHGLGDKEAAKILAKKWMEESAAIVESSAISFEKNERNRPSRMIRVDDGGDG